LGNQDVDSSVIKTQNLVKKYSSQKPGFFAINDLTLSIPSGQMFGLIGPDGAGKTTTLRILSTVLNPTSGLAQIGGFDTNKQAEHARRLIGYMPQNFSLYPDLSVIENLNFFADVNGVRKNQKKERIERMLSFTRLDKFTARKAGNLSGGMKKKLALACALMHEPRILLLDEPSTGVDPVSRRELWLILSQVVQEGVTVLVSTPYMDEAERCSQVAILYQGQKLTSGSPKELQEKLPFQIVEIKTKSRKFIRAYIQDHPLVSSWRPIGDRLRLSTTDPDKLIQSLEKDLKKSGEEIKVLRKANRTMEDVFIYLVEEQRRQT